MDESCQCLRDVVMMIFDNGIATCIHMSSHISMVSKTVARHMSRRYMSHRVHLMFQCHTHECESLSLSLSLSLSCSLFLSRALHLSLAVCVCERERDSGQE